jgi:hypothetical protein
MRKLPGPRATNSSFVPQLFKLRKFPFLRYQNALILYCILSQLLPLNFCPSEPDTTSFDLWEIRIPHFL